MTQLQERPPSSASRRTAPRRRRVLDEGQDARSVRVGLILTMIFWPLLLWLLSLGVKRLSESHGTPAFFKPSRPAFDIEFSAESRVPEAKTNEELIKDDELKKLVRPPIPEEDKRLVPTNPDAPENVPDNTRNLGARNQQVAQETPNLGNESDLPTTFSEDSEPGSQIKNGEAAPIASPPAAISNATEAPTFQAAQTAGNAEENVEGSKKSVAARDLLPGVENTLGDAENASGSHVVKLPLKAPVGEERVQGDQSRSSVAVDAAVKGADVAIDPKQPRPRPRLQSGSTYTLIKNNNGTSRSGIAASDSRWSQYGEYDEKMWEAIADRWREMSDPRIFSPPGAKVVVQFRLNNKGEIAEILSSQSTAGTQLERVCISAITLSAPFGPWPADMRSLLGDSIVLQITFRYR